MCGACAPAAPRGASPRCPRPACPTAWTWTGGPGPSTPPTPCSAPSGACRSPAGLPPRGPRPPELASIGFLGANGLKIHDGAVWVTNLDQGTVLRIPVQRDGRAGAVRIRATGLAGIDDFAFTGRGDRILAALNGSSEVALVRPDGTHSIVLTAADGLQNPTSVALRGSTVHVGSAAYVTGEDPNLVVAHLND